MPICKPCNMSCRYINYVLLCCFFCRAIELENMLLDAYWHRHLLHLIQNNKKVYTTPNYWYCLLWGSWYSMMCFVYPRLRWMIWHLSSRITVIKHGHTDQGKSCSAQYSFALLHVSQDSRMKWTAHFLHCSGAGVTQLVIVRSMIQSSGSPWLFQLHSILCSFSFNYP